MSFLIHGALFITYVGAVYLMSVWNTEANNLLVAEAGNGFQNPQNLETGYANWMNSYYQLMLVFSWANCLVQLFTIYIFYNLTRKIVERKIDNPSLIS